MRTHLYNTISSGVMTRHNLYLNAEFALTVNPALAIVLYHLAVVPNIVQFVPAWRVDVEVAALYVFHQTIVECTERFASDLRTGSFPNELDGSLAEVYLLKLDKNALESNAVNILVPMVHGETIMMNGDGHSFVDAIAPYTLIKCISPEAFNSSPAPPKVSIFKELENCGLLEQSGDTRLLRALLAQWQGSFDMDKEMRKDQSIMSPQSSISVNCHPQLSKAFPETAPQRNYQVYHGQGQETASSTRFGSNHPPHDLNSINRCTSIASAIGSIHDDHYRSQSR